MEVDAAVKAISHDESRRQFVKGDGESENRKGVARQRCVREGNDAVEIVVVSRLLPDQRIHAPTTLQLGAEPCFLQSGDDAEDVRRVHHVACDPRWILLATKLTRTISISIMSRA